MAKRKKKRKKRKVKRKRPQPRYSGRLLHHKNDDHWDNRPSNLKVVSRKEHGKIHKKMGNAGGHPRWNKPTTESRTRRRKKRG